MAAFRRSKTPSSGRMSWTRPACAASFESARASWSELNLATLPMRSLARRRATWPAAPLPERHAANVEAAAEVVHDDLDPARFPALSSGSRHIDYLAAGQRLAHPLIKRLGHSHAFLYRGPPPPAAGRILKLPGCGR